MAQDWDFPALAAAPVAPPMGYALRPLTTGELLDRIFTVFRAHFWLFAGLAAVASGWSVVLQGLQLLVHHFVLLHYGAHVARSEQQVSPLLIAPLVLLVAAVAYAAGVYAMGEVYLGRAMTAGDALTIVRGKWLRYIGILLWHYWSAIWLPLLVVVPGFVMILAIKTPVMMGLGGLLIFLGVLGGGVYGAIAFLRNALALPASIVEGSGVRASMRRSKDLAAGAKGKLFVVLLIAYALYLVAGMIQSPLLFLMLRHPAEEHITAQGVILVVGFIGTTLVTPVIVIGYALVYFDQRVRKEGFDLLMLLGTPLPVPELFPGLERMPVPVESAAVPYESVPGTEATLVPMPMKAAEIAVPEAAESSKSGEVIEPVTHVQPIGEDGRF
jgi:hypothetical protein